MNPDFVMHGLQLLCLGSTYFLVLFQREGEKSNSSKQDFFWFSYLGRVNSYVLMSCQTGLHLTPKCSFSLLSNSIY